MADISRTDMPPADWPDYRAEVITGVIESSAVLSAFPTVRTNSKLTKIPVLGTKPTASFVGEDLSQSSSIKPTSEVTVTESTATMETLAVIVPIKKEVAMDLRDGAGIDAWQIVRPQVSEAFAYAIDKAILFGDGAPTSWGTGLSDRAEAAGNYVAASNPLSWTDFSKAMAQVEDDDYDVNVVLAHKGVRQKFREMVDDNNRPLYLEQVRGDGFTGQIFGADVTYGNNSGWDRTEADAILGDRNMVRVFVREELNVLFSEEASYTDGATLKSAFERNVILARFEMRLGWTVFAPRTGFPFSNINPAGGGS